MAADHAPIDDLPHHYPAPTQPDTQWLERMATT
jgi:hypothetical protein